MPPMTNPQFTPLIPQGLFPSQVPNPIVLATRNTGEQIKYHHDRERCHGRDRQLERNVYDGRGVHKCGPQHQYECC